MEFGFGNRLITPNIRSYPSVQDQLFPRQQQPFNQPPQSPRSQPQYHQNQSLAGHFHLLHLVENLAGVIENGTRDQQTDALVSELSTQFERCQQLLNSIGGNIEAKSMTVEEQKRKLEGTENLLAQRRDLIANHKSSVEELISPQT